MKKIFKALLIIVFSIALMFVMFFIITKPAGNIQGIHLIPKDALIVVETDQPYRVWDDVVNNTAWTMLQKNEYLSGIDSSFKSLDSLISENKILYKLVGKRTVYASIHQMSKDEFESFIVVDLKGLARFSNINSSLISLLGNDYDVSSRYYQDNEITEIFDKNEAEYIYISYIDNQAIISYSHKLIEASIDQYEEPFLSRQIDFLEVQSKVRGKNMLRFYINYNALSSISSDNNKQNDLMESLYSSLSYSGLSFLIKEKGDIVLEGNTSLDTTLSFIKALHKSGNGPTKVVEVAPSRTAFFAGFSFKDFETFYSNLNEFMQTDEEKHDDLQKTFTKIERNFEISIKDNFFSWIDNELAILQIQPENIIMQAEYAVVFKAKSKRMAEKNLDFIVKQVKRNTPGVKFKDIEYKGYTIYYLSIPKFFKLIFGKLIKSLEKPYFTVIDDYVIFSNHPQTLKSIIQNYLSKNTLSHDNEFTVFLRQFSKTSNMLVYINGPLLFNNVRAYVEPKTWVKLKKNKEYVICYPHIAFQLEGKDELLFSKAIFNYNPDYILPEGVKVEVDSIVECEVVASEVHISDLDAESYTEKFNNGSKKFTVDIEKGKKHGAFKEYYPNGKLKVKGRYKHDKKDGVWKYFDYNNLLLKEEVYNEGEIVSDN